MIENGIKQTEAETLRKILETGNRDELLKFRKVSVGSWERLQFPDLGIHGWSALHFAVKYQNLELCECLLTSGMDPNIQEYQDDATPLHYAVACNRRDLVQMLLDNKANPDLQKVDGDTALIQASSDGLQEIANLLIARGADLNIQDSLGWTALLWASTNGHTAIVQSIVSQKIKSHQAESEADRTALLIATSVGNLDIAKLLVHEGFDFGGLEYQKALMLAANNGHSEIVDLLRSFSFPL
ncbi:hypothetical protein LPTSP4_08870 [Leptospira ryugenii]|uniref:Uncharacterized protein n=1 Tax=Leptospira ryugenii TaxID=1917863 RepID=A0A2P2DXP5_9LEPT|nr:ankyrin repeat domain-containing protein [Leptospira ryugenii]GBF49376.1 hypothetical protein LPTSP4_08870 [Leptospira ryugenii]